MPKISLSNQDHHPLAKMFYDLGVKIEQLGTGVDFTDATMALGELRQAVEAQINDLQSCRAILDEIEGMATEESDTGPVFNTSFLDNAVKSQRFVELFSR